MLSLETECYMKKDYEPYDREKPTSEILSAINSIDRPTVFIIFSDTGVGKSSVVNKVISKITSKTIIQVKALPDNYADNTQGYYIFEIFNAIREFYSKKCKERHCPKEIKRLSFSYYIKHSKNKALKKQALYNMIENVYGIDNKFKLNIIKIIARYFLIKKLSLGNYDPLKYCNNSFDNIIIATDYIKYILEKEKVLLNVDNLQNIDNLSIKFLMNLFVDLDDSETFFLFEYTTQSNNRDNLLKLKDLLETSNIEVVLYPLPYMEKENAIYLAKNYFFNNEDVLEDAISEFYSTYSKGNLRKLEDYALAKKLESNETFSNNDPTTALFDLLNNNEKFFIAILALHNGKISKLLMQDIFSFSQDFLNININIIIEPLLNKYKIIEYYNDIVKIKHSSILDSWRNYSFSLMKYDLLAYRTCEKYYSRLMKTENYFSVSKEDCLTFLFKNYAKIEPLKLYDILDFFDEVVLEFISLDKAWEYIKNLIDCIKKPDQFVEIYYRILKICSTLELYKESNYCLNILENIDNEVHNEKYMFYKCLVLGQLEQYKEAILFSETVLEQNVSVELQIYMLLFQIVYYRSINDTKKLSEKVEQFQSKNEYKNHLQYGYFLRLAEAYAKRDEAIPLVKESIDFFEIQDNMAEQAAKSRVSLSFLYAITGALDLAYMEITLAEKTLLQNIKNLHVFEINKACIYLLMDKFGSEVWDMLEKAELTAKLLFNKIAIFNNKIIWCIENKDYSRGRYLEQHILRLLDMESDKHLHAIVNYNLYVLNEKTFNNPDKAQFYYNKAFSLRNHCMTLKSRMENLNTTPDNTTFLLSKPWHVCFVSYWDMDYLD